jgi:LmbE family N-acetylglucosaminyl deacetylase
VHTSTHDKGLALLAVLAHPDDESFGMGGTLALYARRGVAVHLVCATRGEAGDVEEQHLSGKDSIAHLREDELRCAAQILGLAGVHFLGYRDSGMAGSPENRHPLALASAPLDEVTARIVCYIRRIKPQVILTFDPIGGYRHPDHIAVHQATVRAFEAAGNPAAYPGEEPSYRPQKLYFHTFPRRWLRLAVRLMPLFGKDPHRFGKNHDVDLASLVDVDFPVHARIDYRSVIDQKMEASSCHASQSNMSETSPPLRWAFRMAPAQELYTRAYPPPRPGLRERDLFEGVTLPA